MNPTERCYRTGYYSDDCDCYFCNHKDECSAANIDEDDDDETDFS